MKVNFIDEKSYVFFDSIKIGGSFRYNGSIAIKTDSAENSNNAIVYDKEEDKWNSVSFFTTAKVLPLRTELKVFQD